MNVLKTCIKEKLFWRERGKCFYLFIFSSFSKELKICFYFLFIFSCTYICVLIGTKKVEYIFFLEYVGLILEIFLAFVVKDFPGIVIAEEPGWKDCIPGSNGVVNLAGMPISTRWSSEVSMTYSYNLYHMGDAPGPGAVANPMPLEACVQALKEGHDLSHEDNRVISVASK